ncbi:MAG: sulfatase [Phycisphaeraceae bacterium]
MRHATLLCLLALLILHFPNRANSADSGRPPNIIIIFTDDMGYGDLGCYGHPSIRTPHLDQMAREGLRFTDFYSAASVCTPSRAALLTGRYAPRIGMASDKRRVLFPNSKGGLPHDEITIAEVLKERGYATHCVGKWHLGHLPQFLPTEHGFDSYFGIPYSNDMDRDGSKGPKNRDAFWEPKSEYWNVPLIRDKKEIERPADQTTITKRYAEEAVKLIKQNKDKPFFIYLAHSLPHVPLFTSKAFEGKSLRGLYGNVIEEIDWTVGEVIKAVRDNALEKNTIVWFTSDNGPWLIYNDHGGSAGLLFEGKGCSWEGGHRVPGIVWGPGHIPGGRVTSELGSTLDLLPTSAALAGAKLPADRKLDGYDLSAFITGKVKESPRDRFFYYRDVTLWAVRDRTHKLHFTTKSGYGGDPVVKHDPPILFDMGVDPGEKWNIAAKQSGIVDKLVKLAEEQNKGLVPPPSQLENENVK